MANDADRMTTAYGTAPEPCYFCGVGVWVDQELGLYVDARALAAWSAASQAYLCQSGEDFQAHDV